jgi:hypothetical protein
MLYAAMQCSPKIKRKKYKCNFVILKALKTSHSTVPLSDKSITEQDICTLSPAQLIIGSWEESAWGEVRKIKLYFFFYNLIVNLITFFLLYINRMLEGCEP